MFVENIELKVSKSHKKCRKQVFSTISLMYLFRSENTVLNTHRHCHDERYWFPIVTFGFKKQIGRRNNWDNIDEQVIVKFIGSYINLSLLHMVHLFLSEIQSKCFQLYLNNPLGKKQSTWYSSNIFGVISHLEYNPKQSKCI